MAADPRDVCGGSAGAAGGRRELSGAGPPSGETHMAVAKKAKKEAKAFGEVVEVASSAEATYTYIPKDYTVPADADYFHVTTNNTIYGTELHEDLDSPVPMIADMSSDIFSRPIDVS